MRTSSPQIKAVHSEYCRLVGTTEHEFPLTMARIFAIDHWLHSGNTMEDLRLVIGHIQRGIKRGTRYPGALRFTRIIENVENFTEEKVTAKAVIRNTKPPVPQEKSRYLPPLSTDTAKAVGRVMATSAQITELLKAAHEAADQII